MIVTLNDTTASKIGGAIVEARRTVGSGSGLVHTLICICDSSHFDAAFEAARDAAHAGSGGLGPADAPLADAPRALATVSRGLGEAMVGINVADVPAPHRLAERGW